MWGMKKTIWIIAAIVAAAIGWRIAKQINPSQPAIAGLEATATAAEVEISAKYLGQNQFEIAFTTHSGDLSTYDFSQITLPTGATPTAVNYLSSDIHHPAARLTYTSVTTPTILVVPDLAGVPLTRLEFTPQGGEK